MNSTSQTRVFTFPNGGHSIRKLVNDIRELGDTTCTIDMTRTTLSVASDENGEFNALKLADKLVTLGTRFQVVMVGKHPYQFPTLEFHTDWTDIKANPEFYGVK